jgi:hypothetical protein
MEEEYATQQTGDATTAKHRQVNCEVYGISLAAASLRSHLETRHNIFGHLSLIGTWFQSKPLWPTVLQNCLSVASTAARCHSVAAVPATGSTYTNIFLCNIPRISCASQSRIPSPCHSVHVVDYRHQLRISPEVIITQGCVRGNRRGNANMRLLCPSVPLNTYFVQLGRTWRESRFVGLPITRP